MHLEHEMAALYMQAGLFLRGVGGYYYTADLNNASQHDKWMKVWENTEFKSRRSYNPNNIHATRARGISGMAWGQGELVASPAAIARIALGIANNGTMLPNRYVFKVADSMLPLKKGTPIAKDPKYAALMTDYMKKQSAPKVDKLGIAVAGKTGTPERIARNKRINDGWYVFFAPKANGAGNIVTCVRVENCRGSGVAVRLAGSKVIPVLREKGYIKGFEGSGIVKGNTDTSSAPRRVAADTTGITRRTD
jgi:cell division protein FtsI/penicillin-binding protein 2